MAKSEAYDPLEYGSNIFGQIEN